MRLTVIASGSAGNCYVLEGLRSALILECGVPPKRMVTVARSLDMSKVAGVLVSHEHGDHAGYVRNYAELGLPMYASMGTWDAIHAGCRRREVLPSGAWKTIGDFEVGTFRTQHDAADPVGFVIRHREMGTLLFVTDTAPIPYSFKKMTPDHIMVEANYDDGLLDGNVAGGRVPEAVAGRTRRSHLSIREAVELVKANETAALKTVTLLHLSELNSNSREFQRRMQREVLFADVYTARPELVVKLENSYKL